MRDRMLWVSVSLLALGALSAPRALAADADTLYLTNDGFPHSTLSVTPPRPGDLPNFDPGRDVNPGLLLERTNLGLQETDPGRYQHWQTGTDGFRVSGVPTLVIWAAVEDFDFSKVGSFKAYLLDCPEWGEDCLAISVASASFQARPTDGWVESKASFPEVDYQVEPGRALAVRVVVPEDSEGDLWLAYDRHQYRSRLVFSSRPLTASATPTEPEAKSDAAPAAEPLAVADTIIDPGAPNVEVSAEGVGPLAAYLITLGVSTAVLAGLAVYLLSRLTPNSWRSFALRDSRSLLVSALQSRTRRLVR